MTCPCGCKREMFTPRSLTDDEIRDHASKLTKRRRAMSLCDARAAVIREAGGEWSDGFRRDFTAAHTALLMAERCARLVVERKL